jgi:hypothetical protein
MLEFLLAIALVVVVMGLVILIAGRDTNPNRKRTSGALSGALGAFNEFYQPSAKDAAVIVEEQGRARKQAGSEGKRKPRQE